MGPIEYIGFTISEQGLSENCAHVVFKYASSVQDGVHLMNGTKLYGSAIITESLLKKEKQAFYKQRNEFKRQIDKKYRNQSTNTYQSRQDHPNSIRTNDISYEPSTSQSLPLGHVRNSGSNQDDHDRRLDIISRSNLNDGHYKRRRRRNRKKEHNPDNHTNYRDSKLNRTLDSKEISYNDRELYHEQYDGKNQDYHFPNRKNIIITLCNTEKEATQILSGYNDKSTNYENEKQCRVEKFKSNFNNQQSERYQNHTHSPRQISYEVFKKTSYTSESSNELNTKYTTVQNHSVSKYFKSNDYQSNLNKRSNKYDNVNQHRSYVSFKEHGNEYPNNDGYSQRENNFNNFDEYNREYSRIIF